jgi:hypothetical protein
VRIALEDHLWRNMSPKMNEWNKKGKKWLKDEREERGDSLNINGC